MSLARQIPNLSTEQLKAVHACLVEAGIAYEAGGNWREIFRRAKQRKVGLVRRIYELMEKADRHGIDRMTQALVELMP